MNRVAALLTSTALLCVLPALGTPQPPVPVLPPGHPSVTPPDQGPAADPKDVASIEAIVAAYYDSVSGPAGTPRNWDRFRSLFVSQGMLVTPNPGDPAAAALCLTPQQFIDANRNYFERGGYFERQIHGRVDAFGRVGHVFSTYESRRARADAAPYARGINSIQVIRTGDRWWIVSVVWDRRRPGEDPIPPEYLPPAGAAGQ